MKRETRKATRHVNQNEGLIFEKSSAGKAAWKLPPQNWASPSRARMCGKWRGRHGRMCSAFALCTISGSL